ncbi:MAG: metal-dependent transcriptional regulator [Phycisphaeraceae bacterium]
MTHSTTAQNYLKELYQLQQREDAGSAPVPLGRLAAALSVTPGTATTMVKRFADEGLIRYTPRRGARLTAKGEKVALGVLRRHRIVETFLVEHLGLDWSEVHEEAEVLEHAVSDKVLDRLDALLDHPTADPHGSPIPPAHGKMQRVAMRPLSRCKPNQRVTVGRLLDTNPAFLKLAEDRGLLPDTKLKVLELDDHADAVTIQVGKRKPTTLGLAAADKVLVVEG